ncbi:hypothetical protein BY996DRAFT_6539413 [Phakopsora pachyrhizi]|nr:hypothetical protein BY996DRAFT_6539413 [Phakopsora pachyrhizi]
MASVMVVYVESRDGPQEQQKQRSLGFVLKELIWQGGAMGLWMFDWLKEEDDEDIEGDHLSTRTASRVLPLVLLNPYQAKDMEIQQFKNGETVLTGVTKDILGRRTELLRKQKWPITLLHGQHSGDKDSQKRFLQKSVWKRGTYGFRLKCCLRYFGGDWRYQKLSTE